MKQLGGESHFPPVALNFPGPGSNPLPSFLLRAPALALTTGQHTLGLLDSWGEQLPEGGPGRPQPHAPHPTSAWDVWSICHLAPGWPGLLAGL